MSKAADVVVVGAGPVGLAGAWRCARRGGVVRVLDDGRPGAWNVAAGMLAPVAETSHGEEPLLDLGLRALAAYPEFCAELERASGIDPELRTAGTLIVARDRDERAALERLFELRRRLGLDVGRLLPSAARRLEQALAPTVRLALRIDGDLSVDPRRLVAALRAAVVAAGAEIVPATAVEVGPGSVVTAAGERIAAGAVVVAAGAYAGRLGAIPVRPLRGQVLRLRDPSGPGLIDRTVRTLAAYLVPRGDGRYVLGASMEERGYDTTPTAGATFDLLRDIAEVVPGVLELQLEEVLVGLRPTAPDNLPVIGELDGVFWATGHYRNGILLAGQTGELVAAALAGEPLPAWAAAADPARFARVAA